MAETLVVGISDAKVSADADDTVITYALGSCVGLTLYDPARRVGGLVHVMLPDSRYRSSSREFNPFMYADSGFYELLRALEDAGARKADLVAKLAGGANMLGQTAIFDIGSRNAEALVGLCRLERIPIVATSLGGTVGRSMELRLTDGQVRVRLLGVGEEVL
ncbi:chemotaxis protein CheD [Deferrisoma camini]|uniref:chemotaxis protein CheD n=1 Tax=Deferrisoma camini TaxID=1035120 RepID=UPI00046D85E1|nr:chemotaxis protein CheD [Deferrisoma camini]